MPVDRSLGLVLFAMPSENDCGLAQAVPFEPESCAFEMVAIVPQVVWLTSQRASFGPSKGRGLPGAASGEAAAVATATHRAAAAERAIGGKKEMERVLSPCLLSDRLSSWRSLRQRLRLCVTHGRWTC